MGLQWFNLLVFSPAANDSVSQHIMLFSAAFIPVTLFVLGAVASPLQATKKSGISTTLYNDLVWYFQYASSAYSASCPHPNGNTLIEEVRSD